MVRQVSHADTLEASYVVQQTAKDIQDEVKDGDWSLRVLSLVAGIAMMLVSINGFFTKVLVTIQWSSALIDAFVFTVGLGVVLIESGLIELGLFSTTNSMMEEKAPFFRSLKGRGSLFVITGLAEIYFLRGLLDIIVGLFSIYVGVTYLWMGRRAKQKIRDAAASSSSSSLTLATLQEHFAMADVDGKGSLTLPQFRQFSTSLNLGLNKQETEAAFLQIDKSHTGRLTYESIQAWWSRGK